MDAVLPSMYERRVNKYGKFQSNFLISPWNTIFCLHDQFIKENNQLQAVGTYK